MKEKKITYSLNYRKPKSDYKPSDELMICIRYYHKCKKTKTTKVIKKSTGVKCKLIDWNSDWHKSDKRSPVKETDPNYRMKNKALRQKVKTNIFRSIVQLVRTYA